MESATEKTYTKADFDDVLQFFDIMVELYMTRMDGTSDGWVNGFETGKYGAYKTAAGKLRDVLTDES